MIQQGLGIVEEEAGGEAVEMTAEDHAALEQRRIEEEQAKAQRLDSMGLTLARSRSEAINGRAQSGIEENWEEDEEFYEGVDDANRGEMRAWRTKPPGQTNPNEKQRATASTVFPNITRPYVDAAAARVADMLLPTDDRAWALKPTPVADLVGFQKGKPPQSIVKEIAGKYPSSVPGNVELAKNELAMATQAALQVIAEAKEKAEKAERRIEDWHIECQFHAEVRSVIEECGKLGSGVLKGPFPARKRLLAFKGGKIVVQEEIKPKSKWVTCWNLYPDPACGDNIHNGSHIWEKDDISHKQLEGLKGTPGYIDSQVDLVLREGPMRATKSAPDRPVPEGQPVDRTNQFEIWYYHGNLTREDLEACGCQIEGDDPVSIPAQVTMVNNRVIRAVLNPLDTGEFPYDVMVWQKRAGSPFGIGVARQIRTPQRMVIAATRNMMDNAGRAGGPQLLIMQGKVTPHDGRYEVTPWKIWLAAEDADMEHLDNAFRFIEIPMISEKLMEIVRFGLKLGEDVTGLPMLLQGQQGKAPDTLGGMQMLNNNASTVLRRIARLYDDRLNEPHVRRYYAYLLQYGEDDEKGDFQIDARGSSALVERDLQNQQIVQMGQMVANPIYGLDPKKWAKEMLKSQKLDPSKFEYDDQEWQKVVAGLQKGASDPRLAVAQLRSQTEERITQMEQGWESSENERDRQLEYIVEEMRMKGQESISLTDLKKVLTKTVLELRTQRELSSKDRVTKQVANAAAEPAGRAEPGMAFQR